MNAPATLWLQCQDDDFSIENNGSHIRSPTGYLASITSVKEMREIIHGQADAPEEMDTDLLETLADDRARLLRQIEVLQGRALQEIAAPGIGYGFQDDAVQNMDFELIMLRQLADAELQRLQTRAATNAADTVARGRLEAALLVEAARVQAAATESALRKAAALAMRKLGDVADLRDSMTEAKVVLKERHDSCELLAERVESQHEFQRATSTRIEDIGVKKSALERELRAARVERGEQISSNRRLFQEDDIAEETWLSQHAAEERSEECSMMSSELGAQLSSWRSRYEVCKRANAARSMDVCQQRLRVRHATEQHCASLEQKVQTLENDFREEFVEWQQESNEELHLVHEELALLRHMRLKLNTRLYAQRCALTKLEAGENAPPQDGPTEDQLKAAIAKVAQLRKGGAAKQETRRVFQNRYKEFHAKFVQMRERLHFEGTPSVGASVTWHDTANENKMLCEKIQDVDEVPLETKFNLDFERAERKHQELLLAAEKEVAEEQEEHKRCHERRLASLRAEENSWQRDFQAQQEEASKAADMRNQQLDALRLRLSIIKQKTATAQIRFQAGEEEAAQLRNSKQELMEEARASHVWRDEVAISRSVACERTVEMRRVQEEALVNLECRVERCRALKNKNRELEETLKVYDHAEQRTIRELATGKRHLLQLQEELSETSAGTWELEGAVATLSESASELQRMQDEGNELRTLIASLRTFALGVRTGSK